MGRLTENRLQARNFPRRLSSSLIIEARLNGEVLEADPVPLRGSILGVSTELAWELSKKALHQYKLQRTPIKLQVRHSTHDVGSETRQLLGYVVLDLRSIQQDKTASHWYPLLNCSLAGDKPALNVSLVTEEEQALEHRDGLEECEGNSLPPSGQLLLTLNNKEGLYQLGTPSQDDHLYTISVTLANPHGLETVVTSSEPCYFYYCLLGNDITTEPFSPPTLLPERASVRVRGGEHQLQLFLSAQGDLKIHLSQGRVSLCHGLVPLKGVFTDSPLHTTLQLTQGTSSAHSAPPTVEVTVQVELAGTDVLPSLPASSVANHTHQPSPDPSCPLSLHPTSSSPPAKPPTNSPPLPSARRNLSSSFEEASQLGSLQASERRSSVESSVVPGPSVPPTDPRHTSAGSVLAVLPPTSTITATTVPCSTFSRNPPPVSSSAAPPTGPSFAPPTSSSVAPHTGSSTSAPPTGPSFAPPTSSSVAPHTGSSTSAPPTGPTLALPTNTSSAQPSNLVPNPLFAAPPIKTIGTLPKELGKASHFKFSIDLRSIHNTGLGHNVTAFLKYSYPFFGSPYPVLIQPPVSVPFNAEQPFSRSYCAFDFAISSHHLIQQLHSQPLEVGVWQSQDGRPDQLLGVAAIPLSEVLTSQKVDAGGGGQQAETIVGYLHCVLMLEDHGHISQMPLPPPSHTAPPPPSTSLPPPLAPPTLAPPIPLGADGVPLPAASEYQAAVQLELWKMAEEEAFEARLKQKEEEHMGRLVEEWEQREREREQLLSQKLNRYGELEKQLQTTLRDIQQQQQKLQQKELQMMQERELLSRDREELVRQLDRARQEYQLQHEQLIERERLRTDELQTQNKNLRKQVAELEQRCRDKDSEFDAYRQQLYSKPESRLQAELSMAHMEKVELERKLESLAKSKQHYKDQWVKALRELAAVRQKEQASTRERLRRQQQELEAMRASYLQQEEHNGIRKQLEEVKTETHRLQQQLKHGPSDPTAAANEPSLQDSDVARWMEERDILLQTGVYTTMDPTIQRLDLKIRAALAKTAT
eukprot:Em0006g1237a